MSTALPRPANAETRDDTLQRCITWSQQFSAEYPTCMASHLPMVLVIMDRFGADAQRMEEFCYQYRDTNRLVVLPPSTLSITTENWRDYLGQRDREADYRVFFEAEVARLGGVAAGKLYLPVLFEGIAASAMHAFMRMSYAAMTQNDSEVAISLAYWASTYLCLGKATGVAPVTKDPADVLLYIYGPEAFKNIKTEIDLLWHFMRAISQKEEFAPVVDMLDIDEDAPRRLAETSLKLFASTQDFSALHALTAGHWMRVLAPYAQDMRPALRHYWQAVAALVPKIGFPTFASDEQLNEWRNQKLPEWPELAEQAIKSSIAGAAEEQEHDLSLTFSAWEEYKIYQDPLYRYVTAQRLKLI